MSAKTRGQGYEPSWTEVTIGALLSVMIGAVFGVIFLVIKPVVSVKEMPKEEEVDRSAVYFIEGGRDGGKSRDANAKRKAFVGGTPVILNEHELNSYVAAAPAPAKPAAPGAKPAAAAPAAAGAGYTTGVVNFRIHESQFQIGVPVKIDLFGLELSVMVQTRGTFAQKDGGFVFEPATMLVGSCPVDRLPAARAFVMEKFVATQKVPEDISKAWAKLTDVSVVGSALKLTMP
jgi:hypothetical protein